LRVKQDRAIFSYSLFQGNGSIAHTISGLDVVESINSAIIGFIDLICFPYIHIIVPTGWNKLPIQMDSINQ
jgi:hypothetical protein